MRSATGSSSPTDQPCSRPSYIEAMYPEVPYPPVVIFSKTSDGRWLVSDYFGHHVAGRGPTGWNRPPRAPSPGLSSCPKDLLDCPALFLSLIHISEPTR